MPAIEKEREGGPASYLHETPAERSNRIKLLFSRLDSNGSGFLDVKDLTDRLMVLDCENGEVGDQGKELDSRRVYARELVAACCGSNSDGRIYLADFEQFVKKKEEQLWNMFCKLDVSNSKRLRRTELRQALQEAGISIADSDLDRFMRLIDTSGDGVIDFKEWRDFLLLLPRQPTLENIFSYYQDVYDVDMNVEQVPIPPSILKNAAGGSTGDPFTSRLKYFVAGGISGAFSRSVTAPLDRVKVYLQIQLVQDARATGGGRQFWRAVQRIYAVDGLRGFYRGNGLNIVKIVPESAIKFMVFENAKMLVHRYEKTQDKNHISLFGRFVSGGVAGLCSQFFIYPIETVKTRVMAQIPDVSQSHSQAGPSIVWRTCSDLWRAGGIKMFFRGCVPALIGIVPYAGIDFCVFETLKLSFLRYMSPDRQLAQNGELTPGAAVLLSCGMISGAAGVISVYPFSLVRARLQAQGTPSHPEVYSSPWDVVRRTYQRERLAGFYKGLSPTLMKVLPAISLGYLAYEYSKNMLNIS